MVVRQHLCLPSDFTHWDVGAFHDEPQNDVDRVDEERERRGEVCGEERWREQTSSQWSSDTDDRASPTHCASERQSNAADDVSTSMDTTGDIMCGIRLTSANRTGWPNTYCDSVGLTSDLIRWPNTYCDGVWHCWVCSHCLTCTCTTSNSLEPENSSYRTKTSWDKSMRNVIGHFKISIAVQLAQQIGCPWDGRAMLYNSNSEKMGDGSVLGKIRGEG